ncbi:hypothetical protein GS18_0213625 [Metabacillus indicus]|uniref:Uncharacterized protein n=1 Tax=Metabacillus indicus TaxID=246786 RepID=A0A084GXQ8_METID|nr:hypothetical protein GS18_0213625 [Metabacillus indicus]
MLKSFLVFSKVFFFQPQNSSGLQRKELDSCGMKMAREIPQAQRGSSRPSPRKASSWSGKERVPLQKVFFIEKDY